MNVLHGIVPPLLTPMHEDGAVDFDSLDRLVDHLLDAGVHGIFPLGSSGQVAYLTDAERDDVVRRTVERVAGRVPVVVGVPDFTARRMAEHARRAVELGADAIVATAPLYALQDVTEITESYRMLAASVDVPLIAYDVPVRVNTKLGIDMVLQLASEGVIKGIKDSSGDDVTFRRLVDANRAAGEPLDVLTGHEVMVDSMFLLGAGGAVPGLANVDPAGYVRMWDAAVAGDWDAARKEQARLNRLFDIVFTPAGLGGDAGGIGAFKAAVARLGVITSGTMPAPLRSLDDAALKAIDGILAEVGLLESADA